MRLLKIFPLLVLLAVSFAYNSSRAEISFGLSADQDGLKGFYLAIGEHYRVPEKQIVIVREQKIPDEEMPVVFYLAQKADVAPGTIIKLRLGGKSWMEITTHFGLNAGIYYVPVTVNPGPPYGKAYGHFKKNKQNQWGSIQLNDAEIINFANLKFISDHYQCPADDVIKMRQNGKNFIDINANVKKAKQQKNKQSEKHAGQEPEKKKGNKKK